MTQSTARPLPPAATQLRGERDRFLGFAFAGGDLLLEVDGAGTIRYAAGAALCLTGRPAEALLGQDLSALVPAAERGALRRRLAALAERGRLPPWLLPIGPQGHQVWLAGHHAADRTAPLQLSLRLAPGGDLDPDLGLPDRAAFERFLLERIERHPGGERLTLLDLGDLASLDGDLGPEQMRALRRELGATLQAEAVAPQAAGWLDVDTLGVVHGLDVDPAGIQARVRAVSEDAGAGQVDIADRSASLDLDLAGLSPADAGQALRYAINRFAESKGADFDIHSLREGLDAMVAETMARVVEYRGTVHSEAFDLAFQPIVDLRTRHVHHYELLARFDDGRSPFEMVTFAEQLGVVAEFDLMVSRRALDLLGEPALAGAGLAVNLSGRSLESELFSRALLALLDQRAAPRGRLLFEVTESAAIQQPERVEKVLAALRRRGARICLDDFGSGAAAFHYLRAFRFDYIKIDGDYIRSTDQRDQAILRGMVALCRELGVKTVAEMVESPLQAERLRRLRVDFGQGYWFGRPGPLPASGSGRQA